MKSVLFPALLALASSAASAASFSYVLTGTQTTSYWSCPNSDGSAGPSCSFTGAMTPGIVDIVTDSDTNGPVKLVSLTVNVGEDSPYSFIGLGLAESPETQLDFVSVTVDNHALSSFKASYTYAYGGWSWNFDDSSVTFMDNEHHYSIYGQGTLVEVGSTSPEVSAVPEPSSALMIGLGALGLLVRRQKKAP